MKLLPLDHSEMEKLGEEMWSEAERIKSTALKLSWYMRGGISYADIMNLSMTDIDKINKLIEENLETTKKTKLPFF